MSDQTATDGQRRWLATGLVADRLAHWRPGGCAVWRGGSAGTAVGGSDGQLHQNPADAARAGNGDVRRPESPHAPGAL